MIKKIVLPLIASLGGYYYVNRSMSLQDQSFVAAMKYLNQKNPNYSLYLFRAMLQFNFFKFHKQLDKYILVREFDREGRYLQSLDEIGLRAVQIGPCSLLPSCSQQQIRNLGIGIVKANIHTFRNQQKAIDQPFKIGVNITPNFQIRKYTPYLLKQNVMQCFNEVIELNQISDLKNVDFITLNFNNLEQNQLQNQEYCSMINQVIYQTQKQLASQKREKDRHIHLFLQLSKSNTKLIKQLKAFPQQNILIFNQKKQIQSKNGNLIHSYKMLNKERITWNQFIERIISKTLI